MPPPWDPAIHGRDGAVLDLRGLKATCARVLPAAHALRTAVMAQPDTLPRSEWGRIEVLFALAGALECRR